MSKKSRKISTISPLGSQLKSYAARRAAGAIIGGVARAAEDEIYWGLRNAARTKRSANYQRKKGDIMSNAQTMNRPRTGLGRAPSSNRPSPVRGRGNNSDRAPVEVWVNTVLQVEAGARPVRIGVGRDLNSFTKKPVNTSNEDLNADNSIHNYVTDQLNALAAECTMGEDRILLPANVTELPVGSITLQVYRSESDPEGDAVAEADMAAQAKSRMESIFGVGTTTPAPEAETPAEEAETIPAKTSKKSK